MFRKSAAALVALFGLVAANKNSEYVVEGWDGGVGARTM